jgi:hypothetical protein
MTITKTCPDLIGGLGDNTVRGDAAVTAIPTVMSDTQELSRIATKIWVANAGNITVTMANDFASDGSTKVTIENVPSGTLLQGLAIRQLWNTGTDQSPDEISLFG